MTIGWYDARQQVSIKIPTAIIVWSHWGLATKMRQWTLPSFSHPMYQGWLYVFMLHPPTAADFLSQDNFSTIFRISFIFSRIDGPGLHDFFVMTLTLNFQGQIWILLYLSQNFFDCNEMKSKCINWTLGLKCDHRVYPWPWPWPWIFKVRYGLGKSMV